MTNEEANATQGNGTPILAARRLSIQDRYSTERLRDLSLEIYKGDVAALVGPSEDGKRLLLRCLDLRERPVGGNIEIDGQPVRWSGGGANRTRRKIGMAFSRESLFPNLTVFGNMTLAPEDSPDSEIGAIQERVKKLLKFAGLSSVADLFPVNLTLGQRRRLAIVRALMLEPEILLIEDPAEGLDPESKAEVYALIREVVKTGMTVLFSSCDLDFVREIATRVLFMTDGVIREDGPVNDVLNNPQFDRTKAFVQKHAGFFRELNARAFDLYDFEGEIEVYTAGKLVPTEKRRKLCDVLKILLLQLLFPRISRISLTVDVKSNGDISVNAHYPGTGFDPLTQSVSMDYDAAREAMMKHVKTARYAAPQTGKNVLTLFI